MTRRLEITLGDEQWQELEDARGHEPRASFVKRALRLALHVRGLSPVPGEPGGPPVEPDASAYAVDQRDLGDLQGRMVREVVEAHSQPARESVSPAMARQAKLNKAKGF